MKLCRRWMVVRDSDGEAMSDAFENQHEAETACGEWFEDFGDEDGTFSVVAVICTGLSG